MLRKLLRWSSDRHVAASLQSSSAYSTVGSIPSKLAYSSTSSIIQRTLRSKQPWSKMDTNVFKFCTGLKILGSFMVLVVLGIVAVTYYAIVFATYGPDLMVGGSTTAVALLVLVLFHGLLVMLLWCYFTTLFSDPGGVPEDWSPYSSQQYDLEAASEKLLSPPGNGKSMGSISHEPEMDDADVKESLIKGSSAKSENEGSTEREMRGPQQRERSDRSNSAGGGRSGSGTGNDATQVPRECWSSELVEVRRCKKCLQFKPPRTHHCSVCRRCILKMDHHCVWVVNCVGARNYKSFILFMVYTCLESFVVSCALFPRFITFFKENIDGEEDQTGKLAAVFLSFVLNAAFALSLLGFLAMHYSLVAANTTTIEAFEKSKASSRWRYDMGHQRNFEQVFGRDRRYWLLPLYSREDWRSMPELSGLEYPCRVMPERQLRDSIAVALDLD